MRVAGLDVDTKGAHFAVWDGKSAVGVGAMKEREDTRFLTALRVDVVYIEEIPYVRNAQTMRKLSQAVGCWKERCEAAGLRVVTIPVSEWKMLAVGNGRATKGEVRDTLLMTTDLQLGHPEHIYDAAGIGIAGFQMEKLAGAHPLNS